MYNLRKIDKFYLSGGWQHVPQDTKYLPTIGIKAVLDLQFIPGDSITAINFVRDECEKNGIEYRAILMQDDEFNQDIQKILEEGSRYLSDMSEKYPAKKNKILVKCAAGISRSVSMLMYHYCTTRRMSAYEALAYIRAQEERDYQSDFGASPNVFFRTFLQKKFKDSTYEV